MLKARSLKTGPVTLASGKTSNFYIDCKETALHAQGAALIGQLVFDHVVALRGEGLAIAGVGGLTMGADPIALATAVVSAASQEPVHAFIVRKEPKGHGTQSFVEGRANLPAGSAVLIVEDVVTTGGSTLKAIERARAAGLSPVAVLALVDREEGGAAAIAASGVRFAALFTRSDFGGS
ncbi:MAG: orotate phosphoribosyltransferase [Deltaproteobacteria bacterium]|nr:orotate phosphoribosyltransferase [Deltaproteobacteria bacterium]